MYSIIVRLVRSSTFVSSPKETRTRRQTHVYLVHHHSSAVITGGTRNASRNDFMELRKD